MNRYPLHRRPSWLIGRAADQVHIALGHESISRCHARVAFDATGVPWLRDCKSTHGVTVNKKRLPPASIGTVESNSIKPGSRGVVIHPGDVIQFGASTRIYCVEGPPEFQRGSIRLVPPKPKIAPTMTKEAITEAPEKIRQQEQQLQDEEKEDAGVGWGISMDEAGTGNDTEDVDDESLILKRQQALEDGANIPDKHRKAWEKIAALKYKLKNVLLESERIEKKGDLTTGQEHQLQRNRQRSQEIQEKINERERELYEKLFPSERASGTKSRRRQNGHDGDDDDIDDFFDRTKNCASSAGNGGAGETEASLLVTWKDLREKRRGASEASERTQQKLLQLQKRLEYLQARGDDDAFFAQNDLDLVKEQSRKLDRELSVIDKEMTETKRLLKIVNPKLVLEEKQDATTASSPSFSSMAPPPGRKIIQDDSTSTDANSSVVMPPPGEKSASDDKGFMMPPPSKRARTVEPVPPPPNTSTVSICTSTDALNDKGASISSPVTGNNDTANSGSFKKGGTTKGATRPPVVIGTLAALTAATSSHAGKRPEGKHSTNDASSGSRQQAVASTTIDLKKDEWQAPKDQDGSGRTKLNAKFAGRY